MNTIAARTSFVSNFAQVAWVNLSISLNFILQNILNQNLVTRYNFWFFVLWMTLLIFFSPQFANAQNDLLKVAEGLKKSEGKVTAYYPPSVEKQAKSIQDLLEKAVDYYNKELEINFPISVVLFGPEEYARYIKEKFGNVGRFLPAVEIVDVN
jgi:hypothetical protein